MKYCPCGSNKRYLECCGAYLLKKSIPNTPEALMRSRYTAYVEGNIDYIRRTMRGAALLNFNKHEAKKKVEWRGLEIINADLEPENPAIGYVEFKAKYEKDKQELWLHEKSEFHLIDGRWYYVDGN
jgi:SEC-C motif-containing protein